MKNKIMAVILALILVLSFSGTVFAESDVISLIAKGEKREVIAYAIHDSIASKVIYMVKRIDIQDDIVFAGGCARNPCLRMILEERLQRTLYVHENPYMHAAYGEGANELAKWAVWHADALLAEEERTRK